jgi:CBS domain-containing protein
MPSLSEIQHRPVVDARGETVGRLKDLAILPRDHFPSVQWGILSTSGGERVVRWSDLSVELERLRLRRGLESVATEVLPPEALRLGRDVLDKQIVDTHGAKVVRVNDLQLEETGGQLRLVGADVGLRGLVRRIGAEGMAERIAAVFGQKMPRGVIPWNLVEPLETPEADVRLTVPHEKLAFLHPADIADVVEEMPVDERRAVFEQLDVETAAEALAEVEPEMQAAIVSELEEERAADILQEMAPDEAADVLQDLPEEQREELVDLMETDEAEDVEKILAHPEDSAGGIMTTDVIALPRDITAQAAIDRLRQQKPDPELAYYLYVTDEDGRLEGTVSLRDLVVADPDTSLMQVMDPHVLTVDATSPKEDVAALMAKYDLLALPVVDGRHRLIGAITVDDVVELMLPRGWKKRSTRKSGA